MEVNRQAIAAMATVARDVFHDQKGELGEHANLGTRNAVFTQKGCLHVPPERYTSRAPFRGDMQKSPGSLKGRKVEISRDLIPPFSVSYLMSPCPDKR